MAEQREHTEMSKVIAKAMAEATWIAIQTMAETQLRGGRDTMRTQDRWSSTKAVSVQLGCDRQVLRVVSLHVRGKECIIHLQHTRA